VKSYSAEPVRTPVLNAVKSDGFSSARSARLHPGTSPETQAALRHLKPRFLEGLTPPQLKSVVAAAKQVRFQANSMVIYQDHPAQHLYLLLTGRARHFYVTEKGKKVILLWIPPGEIFGFATFMPLPTGYHVSSETVKNSSVLVWDRATIRSLTARYPRLVDNALYLILHYLAAYRAAHMSLIVGSARERLAYVLVSLASEIGDKVQGGFELKVKNEELANEANVTLFTASRLLSEWQRRGMLLKSRGKILLRSPELLLRYAA
jgi:CRP-like cAMP-binding protein